jgi:hypothetical protein
MENYTLEDLFDDILTALNEEYDKADEDTKCDGNCEECDYEGEEEEYDFLEPIEGVHYGFEDVLSFVKRDKYRAFTCHSFKDGEYIYLDDVTYDTPTLVKVGEHDMHSVYVPTAEDMFDYVWELVAEG